MRVTLRHDARRLGFTLIELMVVLILIAIMTALIIPEMKGTYEDALLRSTGRKLVDVFNLSNSRAITVNQLHRVRLDRKNGRYLVERTVRSGEGGSGFVPARELSGGDGTIDTRISIEFRTLDAQLSEEPASEEGPSLVSGEDLKKQMPDETIAFYPDGTADAMEVVLRDRQGFRLALRINPTTARVRVVELERE